MALAGEGICMAEAGSIIGLKRILGAMLVAGGLVGCAAEPSNMQSASRQDDVSCGASVAALQRAGQAQQTAEQLAAARSSVVLATEAGAGPVGTSSAPPSSGAPTPEAAYARCMRPGHN